MSLRERFGFIDSRKLVSILFEMKDEIRELHATLEQLRSDVTEVNRNITILLVPLTDALAAIKAALVTERAANYNPQGDETDAKNLKLAAAVVSVDKLMADAENAAAQLGVAVEEDNAG